MGKYCKESIEKTLSFPMKFGAKQASSRLGARYQTLAEQRSIRKRRGEKSLSRKKQAKTTIRRSRAARSNTLKISVFERYAP